MIMRMLEAGGISILTDHLRQADDDNPKGYYEFERVKQLESGDHAWLATASGKAVKIISALLQYLPPHYTYKVIFMHRAMPEVLASQRKMLANRGETGTEDNEAALGEFFAQHKAQVQRWLEDQPGISVINIDYNQLIDDPAAQVNQVNQFLQGKLNVPAMLQVIDPALYRQRSH